MKKLSLILMLISFWSVSSAQTLRVYNYTSCALDVKAYADTVCGWNCPSAVVSIIPGNYYDLSMINCTWTSAFKWQHIKYWKSGYYPPMTGGSSQRNLGCGPPNIAWNCGGGGGNIYGVWSITPWEVYLYD